MIGIGKRIYPALIGIPVLLLIAVIAVKCISVLKIALIALIISYLLSPLVLRLSRKMPRSLAILIVYASLIFLTMGIAASVLFPMLKELSNLPEYVNRLGNIASRLPGALSERFEGIKIPMDMISSVQNMAVKGTSRLLSAGFSFLSGAAGFLADVLIALALSWFFLIDWEKMSLRMFLCVPSGIRPKVITALTTIRRDLGGYLRAQSIIIGVMFIITVALFFITRAPMPVSLAVMYSILNAIPYFGPLIGTIPPVLAALTISPVNALSTLAALLIIQQIDNYILSPRIMGAASNSGPAAVLISISAGGALLGVPGMFLALPTLVSVKSVLRVFTSPQI